MAAPETVSGNHKTMERRHFALLQLALVPGLPPRERAALLTADDLEDVLAAPARHVERLPAAARGALLDGRAERAAESEMRECARRGVRLVAWGERSYPALLAVTCDPPPVLWVRGSLQPDDGARGVAVVGARRATVGGRALARSMARELAAARVSVVSGLALGIDGEAHRGALDGGGHTVAVLGSGLGQLYPSAHVELARSIERAGGALVSEFPLETPPYKGNFPRRNRVIAGWTPGVVVVEAATRSGALVTARLALEEGREVMAVPGHPGAELAAGTNSLIRDGATLVRGAADVAEQLGWELPAVEASLPAEPLLAVLRQDVPCSLDELQARSGVNVPQLLERLTELELQRKVLRLPGALYVRAT
jgi:DNA processing protein